MTSTFTQQVAQQVLPALASAVSLGLTALLGFAAKWLNDHVKSQRLKSLIGSVDEAVETAVKDVSNTEVDILRKASADGMLDAAARAQLKSSAIAKAKALLGHITLANLATSLQWKDDADSTAAQKMEAFLASYVEKGVWLMKLQEQAVKTATPTVIVPAKLAP